MGREKRANVFSSYITCAAPQYACTHAWLAGLQIWWTETKAKKHGRSKMATVEEEEEEEERRRKRRRAERSRE